MLTNSLCFNWSGSDPYREICKDLFLTSCERFFFLLDFGWQTTQGLSNQQVVFFVFKKNKNLDALTRVGGFLALVHTPGPAAVAWPRNVPEMPAPLCRCLQPPALSQPPAAWGPQEREELQGGHAVPSESSPILETCLHSWARAAKTGMPFLEHKSCKEKPRELGVLNLEEAQGRSSCSLQPPQEML